jgi:site-specific recombinase XerD
MILTFPVYRTILNYKEYHRNTVANALSVDEQREALFLQPNGRRITPGYLRDHISPVFKRITKEPTAHLYTMRHTYETYLYDRARDIEMVADYLGHKHLDNVNAYIFLKRYGLKQGENEVIFFIKPSDNHIMVMEESLIEKEIVAKNPINLPNSLL